MNVIPRFVPGFTAVIASLMLVALAHAASPTNSSPDAALYIDGQPQTIAGNSSVWYKYEYAGDRSEVTVLMPNGANTNVTFSSFTPEEIKEWWDTKPIGRGTAYQIDCETGEEDPAGQCQSTDLKWVGKFNAPGAYYIEVVNYNRDPADFTLTIAGSGVSVGALAVPTMTVKATPAPLLLPVAGGVWRDAPTPTAANYFKRE